MNGIDKSAVVVGGSNGIGLAITLDLIKKGYYVIIIDRQKPDKLLKEYSSSYKYFPCDLTEFNEELFENISTDKNVEVLMITSGIGRIADFENLHISEIDKTVEINATAAIKIISIFYSRIKNEKKFYCGVVGSIAGLVSSPMFSVYAASKAALCRFVESVNIELECSGFSNRILNISPGSIKGTKFNGAFNDITLTQSLASEITNRLLNSEEFFIPDYDEVYKGVIERYNSDAHEFGINSYQYKKDSGRACNEKKVIIGYLSGTFDLFHVGHLNLLRNAKTQCDYLIVGVHPDASHKGKETFISFEERLAIVSSIKYVDKAVQSCAEDSEAWERWHYNRLFVGSDYKGTERFKRYEEYFSNKGTEIVYFPYTKGTSSTQLRNKISNR